MGVYTKQDRDNVARMTSRATDLADAYEAVARINHYMVGLEGTFTDQEREDAEQILITRQNAGKQSGAAYKRLDLALDLIQADMSAALRT